MRKPDRVNEYPMLSLCGCGRLHFTYGPMTLHFDRHEFLLFAIDVNRMAAQVRQITPFQTSATRNATVCHRMRRARPFSDMNH